MLIEAVHFDSLKEKAFVSQKTGKPGVMYLIQATVCESYPDVTRDFFHTEFSAPFDVDPATFQLGWHWMTMPTIKENSFGLKKIKGLDISTPSFLPFTPENAAAMESGLKSLQSSSVLKSAPPPAFRPVISAASHAAPVTARPEGLTVANKV